MATTQTNLGYPSPPTAQVFSYLKFRAKTLEGLGNKMQGLGVHNEAKVAYSFPKFFAGVIVNLVPSLILSPPPPPPPDTIHK